MDWSRILTDSIRNGLGMLAAVYALAGVGLNVQFGFTGLTNYGQAAFLLMGAYGTAVSVSQWNLPLPLAFLVGILAAIGLGLLLGIPTLRLRADYLAIVTISTAEILRIVVNSRSSQDLTGGPQGIKEFASSFYRWNPIPDGRYGIGAITYTARDLWPMLVCWGLVALTTLLVWLLTRSPWGRVLKAVREDEDAARALGKNVVGYKLQSLVLGGSIGALAGIMLAVDAQFVEPRNFNNDITFFVYAALILGGVARMLGPVLGSMAFWFFVVGAQSFLQQAVDNNFLGLGRILDPADVGPVRFILVGVLLMLLPIFRPQGFLGSRSEAMLDE